MQQCSFDRNIVQFYGAGLPFIAELHLCLACECMLCQ
jgi:hypothetical protein